MNNFRPSTFARLSGVLLLACSMHAQQTSGSISGTVKDKQGAVVPGARVTLIDQVESGQRVQTSSPEGFFAFSELVPSTYTLTVEAAGFKKFEKRDLPLSSNSRLGVSDIELEIGALTESITVEASAVQLQAESAEKTGTVTGQMYQELSSLNRSFMNMLMVLPGVQGPNPYSANFNGQRDDTNSFKVDGITNVDSGVQQCCGSWINVDMIQEMKVSINAAPADMGRMSGAQINVVTKSGSKEFHGDVYFFKQAEWMNANSWTNKVNNLPVGRDRNNQAGFTLGGPLFIPKMFNSAKNKVFFFVAGEDWKTLTPNSGNRLMPTVAEKQGDFSHSVNSNGGTVTVIDPSTGTQFPGNIIPANRFNADGVKLLSLFPNPLPASALPSTAGYQYNYQYYGPSSYNDRLLQSYRVDYVINDRWRAFARILRDYNELGNPYAMNNFSYPDNASAPSWADASGLGWFLEQRHGTTAVVDLTTIINPTLTNELVLGMTRSLIPNYINNAKYTEANLKLAYTPLYPQTVLGNYGPNIGFGGSGIANAPSLGSAGYPYIYYNNNYNMADNVAKVFATHTVKAGVMFELDRKDQDGSANYAGNFNFNNDINNNPNETTDQFANLLMGNYETYTQQQKRIEGRYIYKDIEWYVEDTWKIRPNLTLDAGLRFYWVGPGYDAHGQMATFNPALWNPAQTVKLYGYACVAGTNCSGANAKAIDPTTGILYPSSYRGNIVASSGNINNGLIGTGRNLIQDPGVTYGPRLGLAWQPKALPKTVIRAGGGIFYDRYMGNVVYGGTGLPPTVRNPTLYFGNIDTVSSSQTIYSPPGGSQGWVGSKKLPTTVNYNLSIQHEIPFSIMAELGFVGGISRHLIYQQPINEPGFGTAWQTWSQDPTNASPQYNGTTSLPTNFWRPYIGIGGLNMYTNGASSNYNSLQAKAEKRMSRKLSFTFAYTWSKALGVADNVYTATNAFNARAYNYGRRGYDRTQMMTASYIYFLPKFGKNHNLLDFPVARLIVNDWQLSGLWQAQTGTPLGFGFGFLNDSSNINQRWTGNPDYGPRPIFAGNWALPSNQVTEYEAFNINSITVPPGGPAHPSVGLESGFNQWSNPTTFLANTQTTFMKNIMFRKDNDRQYLQIRLETYNTFNHHNFTGVNTTAQFYSPANLTLTNLPIGISTISQNGGRFGFGAKTGAVSPRTLQAAVKIYF